MRTRVMAVALSLVGISSSVLAVGNCALEAATSMEINLSSGVYTERAAVSAPLKIRIPTGINHATYGACLQLQGHQAAEEMTARVSRMRECRDSARSTRIVPAARAASAHIVSTLDRSVYAACLDNAIDVEVLLPSAAVN